MEEVNEAHVAFTEQAEVSFISCDDRLIRKCMSNGLETIATGK